MIYIIDFKHENDLDANNLTFIISIK